MSLATNRAVPDVVATRAALKRVVGSSVFASPRLKAFLQFVVERTLDGKAESIKGYTIGTLVFGRSDEFDPAADPIVRVEAVRLRMALARYYEEEGADDPVIISIPAGGYVPKFDFRDRIDGMTLPKGGSIAQALQQRNGDLLEFRNNLASIRERIAEFEIELAVSRFIIAQAEAIVERNEHITQDDAAFPRMSASGDGASAGADSGRVRSGGPNADNSGPDANGSGN